MKPGLQSKLLRILEDRTVRRIGGSNEIPVDVTAIASTSRNLSEAVGKNEFRKALFFRLSPFYIHIPPLRERKEDIPPLARHFLSHFATRYNKKTIKGFSSEAEQVLSAHNWPGNVRELKNLVERFVVLEDSEIIGAEHMPIWMFGKSVGAVPPAEGRFVLPETGICLEDLEKDLIMQALERTGKNKAQAAKLLGISYDSFRYQLKKFGLG
jgi:transcriptional regulator with PAS, ATPase and Fis domain